MVTWPELVELSSRDNVQTLDNVGSIKFITHNNTHKGPDQTLRILTTNPLLPIWVTIMLLVVLLCLSGLFSGLNLGLMSLDQTELKIVVSTGSEQEKEYAKAIMPIRGMGNFSFVQSFLVMC